MSVNEDKPVKCSDCSVWWRGLTHKCVTSAKKTALSAPLRPVTMPQDWLNYANEVIEVKAKTQKRSKGCEHCGHPDLHSCSGLATKESYLYNCYHCNQRVDYRYSHNCDNGTSPKNK